MTAAGRAGTLLGIVPDPVLSDQRLGLSPGDVLLLYTDGLIESRTPQGLFGTERLAALLASCGGLDAGAVAGRIEDAVVGVPQHTAVDDVALLVLRADAPPRR